MFKKGANLKRIVKESEPLILSDEEEMADVKQINIQVDPDVKKVGGAEVKVETRSLKDQLANPSNKKNCL